MVSSSALLTSFLILSCLTIFTAAGTSKAANVTTKGVCEAEVLTVNILPPELKHTAHFIKGNGSTPAHSKIKFCCAGYTAASRSPFHCLPDCPNGCGQGNCTAPNVCTCNKKAALGPDGKCIDACPKSCLNGKCYGSVCNCNAGFVPGPNGRYCVAGCTRYCGPGGDCVGNNQCKCRMGYTVGPDGSCRVICNQGYQIVNNSCEPICAGGCNNGECISPGRCNCYPGYTLERNGTCSPKCSYPCNNGYCSSPNICSCKEGYVKDPTDYKSSRCVAFCAGGCPNGVCTAPNWCLCNHGYVKKARGSNVCIKK